MRLLTSVVVVSALALGSLAGCSRGEPDKSSAPEQAAANPAPPRSPDGALPRLVFFMNPDGRPCQIQQRVLSEMTTELAGKVELVYYRTTSPEQIPMFNKYGIRSLPALIVTDSSGRELRRATPGIQDAAAIRHLIGS